jgi:hypothetical protein
MKGATKVAANDAVVNGTPVVRNPFVNEAKGNLTVGNNPMARRRFRRFNSGISSNAVSMINTTRFRAPAPKRRRDRLLGSNRNF